MSGMSCSALSRAIVSPTMTPRWLTVRRLGGGSVLLNVRSATDEFTLGCLRLVRNGDFFLVPCDRCDPTF